MNAVYTAPGGETKTFSRETAVKETTKDTSRDAPTVPDETRPLGKLRADVQSIQQQVNEFLTEKMAAEKAQTSK